MSIGTSQRSSTSQSRGFRGPGGHGNRKIEKAKDVRGTLNRLVSYLRPYLGGLIVVFVLTIAYTGFSLAGPYLLGVAIDKYMSAKDLVGLRNIAFLMLGSYLLYWATQFAANYLVAGLAQKALRTLRRDLFEHLQTLSLSFFDRHSHGDLMSRLTNDVDAVNRAVSQNITQLIASLLTLVGVLVMMFVLNIWLALGTLLVIPLMLLLTASVARYTRTGFRAYQTELGKLNGLMEETISGQRVVTAFQRSSSVLDTFKGNNDEVRTTGIKAQTYVMLLPPLIGVLSNLMIAVVAGLGGWLALRDMVSVGVIASFIGYTRQFVQPLRQLADLFNNIQSALAGAERVFEIVDKKPELADDPDAEPLGNIKGLVQFDHVNFSYVEDVPVIKDMNIKVLPGQTIALVGPTGAGKTTIINLLTRFYDIQSGTISIDGKSVCKVQKDSLRHQLGIVLQDSFLFSDTVMENIRYGRLDATDEEVIAAARLANADQFIHRLSKGYQTMLSERGGNLSQGQRQLLAIARAVLADPAILILDEATSSVDTRTEVHIQEALLRLMEGRTSFVIAHRLSTIRNADQILVINDGQIIERGTHKELLAQGGFYNNMYMSQFKGQEAVALPG